MTIIFDGAFCLGQDGGYFWIFDGVCNWNKHHVSTVGEVVLKSAVKPVRYYNYYYYYYLIVLPEEKQEDKKEEKGCAVVLYSPYV